MSQPSELSSPLSELQQLTADEIERSARIEPGPRRELAWTLKVCWSGALPLFFRVDELSKLLEPGAIRDEQHFYVHVLTRVVLNCPVTDLASALETFLKQPGDLQDRVIESSAHSLEETSV